MEGALTVHPEPPGGDLNSPNPARKYRHKDDPWKSGDQFKTYDQKYRPSAEQSAGYYQHAVPRLKDRPAITPEAFEDPRNTGNASTTVLHTTASTSTVSSVPTESVPTSTVVYVGSATLGTVKTSTLASVILSNTSQPQTQPTKRKWWCCGTPVAD